MEGNRDLAQVGHADRHAPFLTGLIGERQEHRGEKPMMAMTTNNSISVKARACPAGRTALWLRVTFASCIGLS